MFSKTRPPRLSKSIVTIGGRRAAGRSRPSRRRGPRPSGARRPSGCRTCTSSSLRRRPERARRPAGSRPATARSTRRRACPSGTPSTSTSSRDRRHRELLLQLLLVGRAVFSGWAVVALLEREQLGPPTLVGLRLGRLQQLVQRVLRRDAAALDDRARDARVSALLEVDEVELAGRADEVEDAAAGRSRRRPRPRCGCRTPCGSRARRRRGRRRGRAGCSTAWSSIAGVTCWPCSGVASSTISAPPSRSRPSDGRADEREPACPRAGPRRGR